MRAGKVAESPMVSLYTASYFRPAPISIGAAATYFL